MPSAVDKEWREVQIHSADDHDTAAGTDHDPNDGESNSFHQDDRAVWCRSPTTQVGYDIDMASRRRQQERSNDEEDNGATNTHRRNMFDNGRSDSTYEDVIYEFPMLTLLQDHTTTPSATQMSKSTIGPSTDDTTISIRHNGDYPFSTGLAVWGGSELMAKYLIQRPEIVQAKKVLELGAGAGLCGLVAHRLGARHTIITDGDVDVLENLRFNVQRNTSATTSTTSVVSQQSPNISCPQLIWGKNLDAFAKTFGKQDLILASDCVYMIPSLEPLWQTVDRLLVSNEGGSTDDNNGSVKGIFLWINLCASAAPLESVLETAARYGFTWEQPQNDMAYEDKGLFGSDTRNLFNEAVYLFRRL